MRAALCQCQLTSICFDPPTVINDIKNKFPTVSQIAKYYFHEQKLRIFHDF